MQRRHGEDRSARGGMADAGGARGTMVQAALSAPVIPGRAQWRGMAAPAEMPRFVVSRLAVATWAAVGGAIALWLFVGGTAFGINPAFWALVAVFVGAPLVSGTSQLLIDRPSPVERYTLTDRYFVVQSERGCHAYNLATLGDVTLEGKGTHRRLLLQRHADVAPELDRLMRFTNWVNREATSVVLADRLEDAPGLLGRIRAAQAGRTNGLPPPIEGVSVVDADIQQMIPYDWGSLFAGATVGLVSLVIEGMTLASGEMQIALFMIAVLGWAGWYLWSGLRPRDRRLLRRGAWVMGQVLAVEQTDGRVDDWRVRYRYPIEGGATVLAELDRSRFALVQRWGAGDLIEVRYDRAHPERHLVRSTA